MGKSSTKKKRNKATQEQPFTGSSLEPGQSARLRTSFLKTFFHLFIVAIIGIIAYSNTFRGPFLFDDRVQIENNQMLRNLDNFLLALKGHHFNAGGYRYIPSRIIGYLSFALNYHFGGFEVWGYHLTNLFIHIFNAFLVYFFVRLTFRTPYFTKAGSGQEAKGERQITEDRLQGSRSNVQGPDKESRHAGKRAGGQAGSPTAADSKKADDAFMAAPIALFAALLFVAHPVQTQAVTYVVQRFASLATLFYLLSLVFYIRGRLGAMGNGQEAAPFSPPLVRGEGKGGNSPLTSRLWPIACYLLSLLSAVLAMKTKEISFTLPIVIILYESVFFTAPFKKKLLFLLPVVLTIVIVPLSIVHSGKPLGEILSDVSEMTRVQTQLPRWDYLMTEMRVITTYIRLLFVPVNQNLDYDYPISHSFFTPSVFLSFLFLFALFATAGYLLYASRGKRHRSEDAVHGTEYNSPSFAVRHLSLYRLIGFGILWFFITLSVESSVIPIADVIFEHRLYLPSVGFFTALATGAYLVAVRLKREKRMIPIVVVVALALSATTYARNNVWKDEASLWEDVVKKSPDKARPRNNLGEIYYKTGRLDEAVRELVIAISLDPEVADTHCNLGVVYNAQGRLGKATGELETALRLNPDNAEAHYNLGVAYDLQGRLDEALREYRTALKLNPDYTEAHNNLGVIYQKQGLLDNAMKEMQAALRLNPDIAAVHNNLGIVYGRLGRRDEAMREFQAALRLNPDYTEARRYLELLNR